MDTSANRHRWRRANKVISLAAVFSVATLAVTQAEPNEGGTSPLAIAQSRVAVGGLHTCARLSSGAVQCWGSNDQGQLGNGTIVTSTEPVAVSGISSATAVTAGNNHSCALLADGTARCWGLAANGQLGDGSTGVPGSQVRLSPVTVSNLSGVSALAAGGFHTCAIVSDGTVKCWGDDGTGQLGDGSPGDRGLLPVAVAGITASNPAMGITAGEFHTCARLQDDTLRCWGHNGFGQLGDGTMVDRPTPVQVQGLPDPAEAPVRALTAGYGHTCALLEGEAATAWCWGENSYGQLGHVTPATPDPDDFGAMQPSATPLVVREDVDPSPLVEDLQTLEGVSTLSAGQFHTCTRIGDGSGRCWGQNGRGQLGTDPDPLQQGLQDSSDAVRVGALAGTTAITAGGFHACAVVGAGMACWGYNFYGQLGGFADESLVPIQVTAVSGASSVTAGTAAACALIDGASPNQPVCWGSNAAGRLGAGPLGVPSTTIRTPVSGIATATAIDAGNGHTCALPDGSGTPRCWGLGTNGELGNGASASSDVPVQVTGLADASAISAGGGLGTAERGHTCATRTGGTVVCWGRNANGQLGDNSTVDRNAPVVVQRDTDPLASEVSLADLTGATNVVVTGGFHSCALVSDGTVWCWGFNGTGQLGDGTTDQRPYAVHVQTDTDPDVDVPLSGVAALAAGRSHTCALIGSGADVGKIKCWGSGAQVGNGGGSRTRPTTPVFGIGTTVATRAEVLAAGDLHTCARLADGRMVCWGENGAGQLGDGTKTDRVTPVQVATAPFTNMDFGPTDGDVPSELRPVIRSIAASRSNTCAAVLDTTVYCWGANALGQLGDGLGATRLSAVTVEGLAGAI